MSEIPPGFLVALLALRNAPSRRGRPRCTLLTGKIIKFKRPHGRPKGSVLYTDEEVTTWHERVERCVLAAQARGEQISRHKAVETAVRQVCRERGVGRLATEQEVRERVPGLKMLLSRRNPESTT